MNIIDAIKEGLKTKVGIRRPISSHLGSGGDGWISAEYVLHLLTPQWTIDTFSETKCWPINKTDILADDWEVQIK